MIQKSSAIAAVLLVIVSAIAAAFVWVVLSDTDTAPSRTFHADFTNSSGIARGSDVRIAGVNVGRVTGLSLQQPSDQIRITFTVHSDQQVLVGSQVTIRYKDLIGNKFLEISQGTGPDTPLKAGATIPVSQTQPALDLDVLYGGFQPLFEALTPQDVNDLTASIIDVFQGQGGTVDNLLGEVGSLTSTLADRDQVIGQLIDNLNSVLGTVDAHKDQTAAVIDRLQNLVSGLSSQRVQIASSLEPINELGQSFAGLLEQARPDLKGTVTQLQRAAEAINGSQTDLVRYLDEMPYAYRVVNRQAQYGSTFNFFLCGVQIVTDEGSSTSNVHAAVSDFSDAGRCQALPAGLPQEPTK